MFNNNTSCTICKCKSSLNEDQHMFSALLVLHELFMQFSKIFSIIKAAKESGKQFQGGAYPLQQKKAHTLPNITETLTHRKQHVGRDETMEGSWVDNLTRSLKAVSDLVNMTDNPSKN